MYNLYRKIEKYDSVIIFGASEIGKLIENEIREFCEETGKTLCFADNSYKKWNEKLNIFSPAKAVVKFPGAVWIIASDLRAKNMLNDLKELNINEKDIIKKPPADVIEKKHLSEKMKRITPQAVISQLDIDLAHHCNLNCAGCGAYSPLIKEPIFADLEIFNRDLERMSYLLRGNLRLILLQGGEPLLNPQIEEFVKSARKYFRETTIKIVTNGILLPDMPDCFWDSCRENKIIISVTKYPINLDYDKLSAIAEKNRVGFEFFGIAVEKTSWHLALDPLGSQDPYESFINCFMANKSQRLKNGKLATCALILNSEYFNKEFGTNIEICPDDYIDIHEAKSGREILDFLSRPIPFCRFCDVKNWTFDNPWHISKREIGEWIIQKDFIQLN